MVKLYDYLFKIIFIGETNCGKTSIINRLCKEGVTTHAISKNPCPTIGVDYASFYHDITNKIIDEEKIKDGKIKCQIWDTAGQEKFAPIIRNYYKNIAAAIIVYDVSDYKSFKKVDFWLNDLESCKGDKNVIKIIIGNKTDKKRQVTTMQGNKYAINNNALFFETNMNDDDSLQYMITNTVLEVYKNKDDLKTGIKEGLNIIDYDKPERNCCCIC